MSLTDSRLSQIAAFVQEHLNEMARQHPLPEHDPVYRWEHTLRVTHYGRLIAEGEKANVEWVMAGCLLHDVAHFECEGDYKSHGRRGAQVSRPFLEGLGYSPEAVDNICYAIAVHVDGNAGYEHPVTLESQAVSDADNVDRFGAFRILQSCAYDLKNRMNTIEELVAAVAPRLQKLERYRQNSPLETATGQALFARQLDRQIAFYRDLIAEQPITALSLDHGG